MHQSRPGTLPLSQSSAVQGPGEVFQGALTANAQVTHLGENQAHRAGFHRPSRQLMQIQTGKNVVIKEAISDSMCEAGETWPPCGKLPLQWQMCPASLLMHNVC